MQRYIAPAQLPIWPDAMRGGPNALLRSAFFAGIASKNRKVLETRSSPADEPEGILIAAQDGIAIKYTGTQLNQYDADVFFEVLHRSRRHPLGTTARFAGGDFLKQIGRTRNDLNYQDLDTSLRRLKRGIVDVKWRVGQRQYVYVGSLISSYVRETTTKLYCVQLDPAVKTLFEDSSYTQLEWEARQKLMKAPLAQWLHSYYSTHARPFPVTVAYLQEKTGHEGSRRDHFLVTLRRALDVLRKQLDWKIELEDGLLTITRPPTESQTRHLARSDHRKEIVKAAKERDRQGSGYQLAQQFVPKALPASSRGRQSRELERTEAVLEHILKAR